MQKKRARQKLRDLFAFDESLTSSLSLLADEDVDDMLEESTGSAQQQQQEQDNHMLHEAITLAVALHQRDGGSGSESDGNTTESGEDGSESDYAESDDGWDRDSSGEEEESDDEHQVPSSLSALAPSFFPSSPGTFSGSPPTAEEVELPPVVLMPVGSDDEDETDEDTDIDTDENPEDQQEDEWEQDWDSGSDDGYDIGDAPPDVDEFLFTVILQGQWLRHLRYYDDHGLFVFESLFQYLLLQLASWYTTRELQLQFLSHGAPPHVCSNSSVAVAASQKWRDMQHFQRAEVP